MPTVDLLFIECIDMELGPESKRSVGKNYFCELSITSERRTLQTPPSP